MSNAVRPEFVPRPIERISPAYGDQLSHRQALHVIVDVLGWGGLAIGPSDCGFALWALPLFPKAVEALDAILDHGSVPIPITFDSVPHMAKVVKFEWIHFRLADAWPGGLTLVMPAPSGAAKKLARSMHGMQTIGIRISRSAIERQISAEADSPITSAAIRYPDGSVVCSYEDAEAIVLERMTALGIVGVTVVGIPYENFSLSVNSTVATATGSSISLIRVGFYEKKDLVAFGSRLSVQEYGDAT